MLGGDCGFPLRVVRGKPSTACALTIQYHPATMEVMSVADNSSRSNACLDLPADFYWYGGGNGTAQEHISLAVEALMGAISAPANRRLHPYQEKLNRALFRKRLEKAAQGKLRPPRELKSLRGGATLFEIRWRDIRVHEVNRLGIGVEVRLIHAQPEQLDRCILGLHAHEKVIIKATRLRPRPRKTLRSPLPSASSSPDIAHAGVSSGAHNMTEVCITSSHTYIV